MSDDSLIQAMPDFVAFLRRDGVVQRHLGGRCLGIRLRGEELTGRRPEEIWDENVGVQIRHAVRRSLATRGNESLGFTHGGRAFEARINAHGRERVICVIREASPTQAPGGTEGVRSGAIERREFFDHLRNAIADASVRERQLALCMIHVGGLDEIGGIIDHAISQQIVAALLRRFAARGEAVDTADWHAARVGEGVIGAMIGGFAGRTALRDLAEDLRRRLLEPVKVGDAEFAVRPSLGVALLGEDGREPGALLDHAQSAMLEARRDESGGLHFYSDSLRLRSLSRLDFHRELREAIAADALALRHAPRHDLAAQQLTAINAYLRWPSELRRDLKPSEFLPVAEATGLSLDLSRWALRRLRRDAPALRALAGGEFRISFGALRQHFASDVLLEDVSEWLRSGEIRASELELRLSERLLSGLSSPGRVLRPLHDLGVRLVVDEFGRSFSSLPRLARMPLWGLQIDRGLVTAARRDAVAAQAAQAAVAIARSLGLVSIASGIDDDDDLRRWRQQGCAEGLGDRFGTALQPATDTPTEATTKRRRLQTAN
jgi:predicted signal transduction protein with EAL and GGDEF domain